MASAQIVLLVALASVAASLRDARPTRTSIVEDGYPLVGFTPKPTNMPSFQELKKRAKLPNATCGYITGDASDALTCNTGYCAQDATDSVLGCCTSYYSANGAYTGVGCKFHTACVPYAGLASCTSDCLNNVQNLICSNSNYPYCMEYYATDIGFHNLECTDTSNLVINLGMTYAGQSFTVSGGATVPVSTVSASGGQSVQPDSRTLPATISPTVPNPGPTNSITPAPVNPKSNLGPIVGGVVGGLAVLVAAAALIWFILSRRRATPQDSAPPQMVQNYPAIRPDSPSGKAPESYTAPPGYVAPAGYVAPMGQQSKENYYGQPAPAPAPAQGPEAPPSPTMSTVSHGQTAFSPVSATQGYNMTSPSLSAQSVFTRASVVPQNLSVQEADGRTAQQAFQTSPALSAHSAQGGRENMPPTNLVVQEADGTPSMPPPPPHNVHEAPGTEMSFRAAPSSNWNGPFVEMPG